jgi:hypothetical protein
VKRSLLVLAVSVLALDFHLAAQTQLDCSAHVCIYPFLGETFPKQPVPATSVSIGNPTALAFDAVGNLYIAGPSIVFKMDPAGMLTRIAGNGHDGFSSDGGPATEALLSFPRRFSFDPLGFGDAIGSLAVDHYGNLFIGDYFNYRIRKVTPDGLISTVAGGPEILGEFPLCLPTDVAVTSTGVLLVTDCGGVSQISADGNIQLLVGRSCNDVAPCLPIGLTAGPAGDVYIADSASCRILHRGSDGAITTLVPACGPSSPIQFGTVYGIALDNSGNLYAADASLNVVWKISADGTITAAAGVPSLVLPNVNDLPVTGRYTGDGGPATKALLNRPHAVAIDYAGNLYIADSENFVVRKVTPDGIISTVAGNGSYSAIEATLLPNPNSCVPSGNGLCTSYITWTTTGMASAQVWVRVDAGPESLFGAGLSCSNQDCAAPWIQGNGEYIFTLYNCDGAACSDTDHRGAVPFSIIQVTAQ